MPKCFAHKISISIISILLVGCATHNVQYYDSTVNWKDAIVKQNNSIKHTFYLIGDAGNAKLNEPLNHFSILKKQLSKSPKNTAVLFLGDNIYEKGMPKKNNKQRKLAEHRINAQIDLVADFKGNTIFIPGNHDYYSDGIKGLKREASYVRKKLNNKNAFLPKKGCPIKKVDISKNIVLLIIDSQWYLENWDKNPTMNDDCSIKTRNLLFDEFESILKKNSDKKMLVALHHPMFSNGSHGGQFTVKSQFYPINNKFPLPILGTMANIFRKVSGISPQDMNNPLYLELKKRLVTLSQKHEKLVFISGHEHNLQYIVKDNKPQIVSGSGSKTSGARAINGGKFSYGGLGYAKIEIFKNGETWVSFYTEKNNKQQLLYKTAIFSKTKTSSSYHFDKEIPKNVLTSVYSEEEVNRSKLFQKIWGQHYRKYYGTKINAKTVNLDTLFGGVRPVRKGGGNQSRSLRLQDKSGKEYVMRALKKSAVQYLQAVAFKNQYIEGQFDNTYAEKLLLDIYTTAHPYIPFIIGDLADAVSVYHTNPKLYFIPKQKALLQYNSDFGDELYMIEERAASGHGDLKSFGFSNKIISTSDLLKNLRKSSNYQIDEDSYIRARLFDMLIGDWDRHEDQWRWATFKQGSKTVYRPIPRDRDQAFSKNDGPILGFLTRTIPALKLMQVYDEDIRSVKWFNLEPYPLDIALINHSGSKNWEKQVKFIQKNLTNTIINEAFNKLPKEVQDETITDIKSKLKGRLNNLNKIAKSYYKHLAKYAVVKGTDKDNWFEIKRLESGKTSVKIFNIKNNKKGKLTFHKEYNYKETSEIWIYGLDDKDVFKISGSSKKYIPLRLIGGQNNDTYNIENGKKVTVYDYKTKKNSFTTQNGTLKLLNNYKTNVYNYKKLKYNQNQLIPSIGANPDDGFKIGFKNIYTVYGFERNPFTQQHTVDAGFYFETDGFDINYTAEFANVFNKWNFLLETRFTSPNFSINHYGFGNETINYEDDFDDDYHRVRLSTYAVSPSIKWKGRMGAEFKIGGLFESIEVEDTKNRFINTLPYVLDKRKNYAGFHTSYQYENFDNKAFPTLGMNFLVETGWKTNLTDSKENNAYITPSIGLNYKLNPMGNIVLATKLKANILIGDTFEFYNAASIGGSDGLRGYRNQRFIGNQSFYQNTDLRLNLRKVKTELIPLQIGLSAGFDYGRVWLKNENSNDWKTSYGGGFWMVGAEMFNLNVSVFDSKEGPYFNFGLGFGF